MSLQGNLKRVEKGYISDLDAILKDLCLHYDIKLKNKNGIHDTCITYITYTHLYDKYIKSMIPEDKILQCSGILSNGNRCSHKSIKETNYLYCKKHIFKHKKINQNDIVIRSESNYNNFDTNNFNVDNVDNVNNVDTNNFNVDNVDTNNFNEDNVDTNKFDLNEDNIDTNKFDDSSIGIVKEYTELNNNSEFTKSNFTKIIINDKLYYIDEKFIYTLVFDKEESNYKKCGYIDDNNENDNGNENENNKYVFIDDPFVLDNLI